MHKEKIMYMKGNIAGAYIDLLVDSGVSHNFACIQLVQAMHLPISILQPAEIMLPNGKKLQIMTVCMLRV